MLARLCDFCFLVLTEKRERFSLYCICWLLLGSLQFKANKCLTTIGSPKTGRESDSES